MIFQNRRLILARKIVIERRFHVFGLLFHHGCEVQNGTANTIQLVDHHALDQAPANIGHHFLELGPVGVLAGIALVGVLAEVSPSQFILAELNLAFNADSVRT